MEGSNLTLEQYFVKLDEAGITVFDLGNKIGTYQLSRINDEGPYTDASCRFMRTEENLGEQKKVSPFERILIRDGYTAAADMNRANAIKGWESRRKTMSVDGKRGS
jgi:hypothetical protein